MDLGSNRGYCLWVVPPNEGKVRKFRFTLGRLAGTLAIAALVGGMFVYMMGDYARLQLLRLENYLSISKLTSEREHLLSSHEHLRSQLSDLKTLQSKSANYEKDVRQRLGALASVIESATALGVFERSAEASKKAKGGKESIGGSEIDCSARGFARCQGLLAGSLAPGLDYLSLSDGQGAIQADLVSILDRYIDALKVIPFGLPAIGDVSSRFGVRVSPFTHTVRMHEGIDFSLNRGSNIYSSAFGVVKKVRRNATYGLVVDVQHNKRLITRYAHLSRALVNEGESVARGQILGLAGSTGLSTGPHLHFEVLVDGRPRDPSRFLELAKELKAIL